MEGLVEARSQSGKTNFAGVLKSLQLQEKQQLSSARIRRAHGKMWNGGVIAVVAPNDLVEWWELVGRR